MMVGAAGALTVDTMWGAAKGIFAYARNRRYTPHEPDDMDDWFNTPELARPRPALPATQPAQHLVEGEAKEPVPVFLLDREEREAGAARRPKTPAQQLGRFAGASSQRFKDDAAQRGETLFQPWKPSGGSASTGHRGPGS